MKTKTTTQSYTVKDVFGQYFTIRIRSIKDGGNAELEYELTTRLQSWPANDGRIKSAVVNSIIGNDRDCDASMDYFDRVKVGEMFHIYDRNSRPLFGFKCIVSNTKMKTFTDNEGKVIFTVRRGK